MSRHNARRSASRSENGSGRPDAGDSLRFPVPAMVTGRAAARATARATGRGTGRAADRGDDFGGYVTDSCSPGCGRPDSYGPDNNGSDGGRSIGPDLVRGVAAILVVYLHACVAYLVYPMPGLVWPVQDSSSQAVSFLFWTIEIFIMPLFLVLAGYFAYRNWVGGGGVALVRSRGRRLLVPMAVAAVVLLPIEYYLWIVGWVVEGVLSPDVLSHPKVPRAMRTHLFGLGHLWFLHYVFFYCVALAVTAAVWRRLARDGQSGGDETGPKLSFPRPFVAAPVVATPSTGASGVGGGYSMSGRRMVWAAMIGLPLLGVMVLAVAPQVVFGFQHAFLPVPSKWLYSGTFFFGGVVIALVDPKWKFSCDSAKVLTSFGAVCAVAAVLLGQWAIERSDATSLAMDIGWFNRLVLATLTVAAAWGISLGTIGLADSVGRRFQAHRRFGLTVSYLAAASFWVYLVHHPLVALLHIDLKWLVPGLSPIVKSMVTLGVVMAVSLVTYETFIRESRLGRLIGVEPEARSSSRRSGRVDVAGGVGDVVRQEKSQPAVVSTDGETVRRAA
jgi:glucans biosynthesis protein C